MVVLQVVADDGVGGWGEAHRIVEIEYIGEADVAFAGSVELGDPLDLEALLELGPDRRAQAVADHAGQAIAAFLGARWLVQQVAAELADVAEAGRPVVLHVLPETAGGELAAQGHGRAAGERRAPADGHGVVVVAGQGQVEHVVAAQAQAGMAEAAVGLDPLAVAHDRGFRQAGGAGGVDVEAGVLEPHPAGVLEVLRGLSLGQAHQVAPAHRRRAGIAEGVAVVDPVAMAGVAEHLLADFLEHLAQLFADHEVAGLHQVQAVHQDLAALGGVDQCADGAELGQGGEDRQQLDAVFQHHRDHAAVAYALGLEGARQAIGPAVEQGVADPPLAVEHRRVVRVQACRALQRPAQGQALLAVTDRGVVQAAQHARHAAEGGRQAGNETVESDQVGVGHGSRACRCCAGRRTLPRL